MRKLLLILAALAVFALASWPVLSGVGQGFEWCVGTACTIGDLVAEDVTVDSLTINPDTNLGGTVSMCECEGGTNCEVADAGECVTVGLLDNANSLPAAKKYLPGYTLVRGHHNSAFDADDDGDDCLIYDWGDNQAQKCDDPSVQTRSAAPMADGLAMETCTVTIYEDLNDWEVNEYLAYQITVYDVDTSTRDNVGDTFTIANTTDGCANLTPNCVSPVEGSYTWYVHRDAGNCIADNNPYDCCTDADTGADCPGFSTVTNGYVSIRIESSSHDNDGTTEARVGFVCNYY